MEAENFWGNDPVRAREFQDVCARLRWFAGRSGTTIVLVVRSGEREMSYTCSPEDFPPAPLPEAIGAVRDDVS